jgi:selenide,water dikinase
MEAFSMLPDPQTNGGLLLAIAPEHLEEVHAVLSTADPSFDIVPIGTISAAGEKLIAVLP